VVTDLTTRDDVAFAILVDSSQKILLAGQAEQTPGSSDFAIVRYGSTNPPPCLFCNDFEQVVRPADWTYLKEAWTEGGGNLIGTPTGKKAIAIADPAFAARCSVCTIETSMSTGGDPFNKLWLLGWYVDKHNTVEVLMKQENGKWILRQRAGGVVVAKTKFLQTITPNTFYDVRVDFDGVNFHLYIDGQLMGALAAAATPNGTVGFQVKNTTGLFGFITVN
jgi:hypothetical protein